MPSIAGCSIRWMEPINFAVEQPFFAVSLGLLHRGVPVIGWVHDPVHDERFRAVRGQGATLNDVPLGRARR